MRKKYDKIIIGAGLYGLYSALLCGKKGQKIIVLECENTAFSRASCINQARLHNGYHYPRSVSTATKSALYFDRFSKQFDFCINKEIKQIYAVSSDSSRTNAEQFKSFCKAVNIPCEEINPDKFFKEKTCEAAFLTKEYTYDTYILKNYFIEKIKEQPNIHILYNSNITNIEKTTDSYIITVNNKEEFETSFLLNATYASTNQILKMLGYDEFKIKYELCEIILCSVNSNFNNYGFTIMDGQFFSIMPFGKTELYSLTSVSFTPHITSYSTLPTFICQEKNLNYCSPKHLGNCNDCCFKPETAFNYMADIAHKYIKDTYSFNYKKSLFSMKPILISSETDDSRPTVIKIYSKNPTCIGILSGKISTIYDLDKILIEQ